MKRLISVFLWLFTLLFFLECASFALNETNYVGKSKTYLGIKVVDKNPLVGIEITNVKKDSAAFNAGIRSGDVLITINGVKTKTVKKAQEAWMNQELGSNVEMELFRRGSKYKAEIKKEVGLGLLGMSFPDDTYGAARVAEGVVVMNVTENSPADKAGIQKMDVIVGFDLKPTLHAATFDELVSECDDQELVSLEYIREDEKYSTEVELSSVSLQVSGLETFKNVNFNCGDTCPIFTVKAKGEFDNDEPINWYKMSGGYVSIGLSISYTKEPGLRIENSYDEETKEYVSTLWADNITKETSGEYGLVVRDKNNLQINSDLITINVY